MRPKAWLATRMPLRLARLPRTASSAQGSRRLRARLREAFSRTLSSQEHNIFSLGPKLKVPGGTCPILSEHFKNLLLLCRLYPVFLKINGCSVFIGHRRTLTECE